MIQREGRTRKCPAFLRLGGLRLRETAREKVPYGTCCLGGFSLTFHLLVTCFSGRGEGLSRGRFRLSGVINCGFAKS